jgi:hypothetical protein
MKNYKALPELTRRLYTVHQNVLTTQTTSPHRMAELCWIRDAYADALRMLLQELLCNLYPNATVPTLSRDHALKFARLKHSEYPNWPDEMILGYALGKDYVPSEKENSQ